MTGARDAAVKILSEMEKNSAYSNLTVDSVLNESDLSKIDRAFTTSLVYGVLQRKITLDKIISGYSKSISKIHPFVLNVLRVGAYQILFMDKTPDSAAVNEAVKSVKSGKQKFAAGFVNAVLRKITSERDSILLSVESSADVSYKYSCPDDLCKALYNDYSDMAAGFLSESLESPDVYARVNTTIISADELFAHFDKSGVKYERGTVANSFRIFGSGSVRELDEFSKGMFFVQDLASQIAISALRPEIGDRVLDICAAPGGKSFTAAQYIGNGKIVSCDLYEARVKLIEDGAKRLKLNNIKTTVSDATVYNGNFGYFDEVICDVPCSGIGVIRRKPEIKYKPLASFESLPEIQLKILENAAKYVKHGKRIMYSTCTLRKAENECVVEKFLSENNEFLMLNEQTLMPQTDGSDGFYYSVLVRK